MRKHGNFTLGEGLDVNGFFFLFGFFFKIEYEKYRHKEKEGEVQSKKG